MTDWVKFEEHMKKKRGRSGYGYSEKTISQLIFYAKKLPNNLTVKSVNKTINDLNLHPTTVRMLFHYLKYKGFTEKDVLQIEIPPKHKPRYTHEEKVLDIDEFKTLLQKSDNELFKLILRIGWDSFGRRAELLNIRLEDIDFRRNSILLKKIKGGDSDERFFSDNTKESIQEWIKKNKIEKGYILLKDGKHMSEKQLWYLVRTEVMKILNRPFFPHAIRHSTSQFSANAGADNFALKNLGGWKSEQVLNVYRTKNRKTKERAWNTYHKSL